MPSLQPQRIITSGKQIVSRLKPYLRWLILGGTLFFLAGALKQHWSDVVTLRLEAAGLAILATALGVTLLAHVWSGWVWSLILREFDQPAPGVWGVSVYLQTNIAKYLPGNVWHLYGRAVAAKNAGIPLRVATFSVLLEPLLMAAAALAIALLSRAEGHWPIQLFSLLAVLLLVHPRVLNPLLQLASRLKGKAKQASEEPELRIRRYPLIPLLGEIGFVALRSVGFLLTLMALSPISLAQVPAVLSAFGFAWLLGLVIPGAPGGIGVFEATAIALLRHQFPPGVILGGVALYRLISILAEAGGAGLAWLDQRWEE
jgi:uncharacterized membrane protein YbhN (UPF0104 family)